MTSYSLNVFVAAYLSVTFHRSLGFEVIQPQHRTVNPDKSASISCEHTADVSSVEDVRLNSISPSGKSSMLCQKGMTHCENVIMHLEEPNKYLFIIVNTGPEVVNLKYECEVTVTKDDMYYTKKGKPTTLLLRGQTETTKERCEPPPPPPPPHPDLLRWILIGLLALMFLYGCVITSFFIRLKGSNRDRENSTYVEMRTAPLARNQRVDIHCG